MAVRMPVIIHIRERVRILVTNLQTVTPTAVKRRKRRGIGKRGAVTVIAQIDFGLEMLKIKNHTRRKRE